MSKLDLSAMQAGAAQAEALLSLLANRHRLMVMCHLIDGEKTVTELLVLGELGQSALSQHLGKLRDAHLVATRRQGQKIHYSIASKQAQLLIETLCEMYKP